MRVFDPVCGCSAGFPPEDLETPLEYECLMQIPHSAETIVEVEPLMASNSRPLQDKVVCSKCGKALDPTKPLSRGPSSEERCNPEDGFYCLDCWLRSLRPKKANSRLAKALERVLLD